MIDNEMSTIVVLPCGSVTNNMTTLADRVKEATQAAKGQGHSVADIAAACGISRQAVYQWADGSSQSIMGEHLVELASLSGYEPTWIMKGKGPKIRLYPKNDHQVRVLKVMQGMDDTAQGMMTKISDSLAGHGHDEEKKTKRG